MCIIASKAKNVRVLPKTEDNTIESETKSKEAKTCDSPQYEIMKVHGYSFKYNIYKSFLFDRVFRHTLFFENGNNYMYTGPRGD